MTRRDPDDGLAITNDKLIGLEPSWRRYHGISVLFDNPGTRPGPGIVRLEDIPVDDPDRQRLYDELADAVAGGDRRLRDRYGLCPLPRHSFHVTVCDGPNERDAVPHVSALLDDLPSSLDRLAVELPFMAGAEVLTTVAGTPVTLVVSEIAIWGHVLVARLAPHGPEHRVALERVTRARDLLVQDLWTNLGLRTQRWRPHVSLGYFPNRDAADAAVAALPPAFRSLPERLRTPITFSSAAVYGFADMVSFFRLPA